MLVPCGASTMSTLCPAGVSWFTVTDLPSTLMISPFFLAVRQTTTESAGLILINVCSITYCSIVFIYMDVYVRDKHQLGLKQWFEQHNPHALAQTMERMLEAARQGYWQADDATVQELKTRWRELARRYDVRTDNAAFAASVGARALPG